MNTIRVQVHTTAPHIEILSVNQMLVELTTPGTVSIVEVHRADLSKPEASPEAIPDIEDGCTSTLLCLHVEYCGTNFSLTVQATHTRQVVPTGCLVCRFLNVQC